MRWGVDARALPLICTGRCPVTLPKGRTPLDPVVGEGLVFLLILNVDALYDLPRLFTFFCFKVGHEIEELLEIFFWNFGKINDTCVKACFADGLIQDREDMPEVFVFGVGCVAKERGERVSVFHTLHIDFIEVRRIAVETAASRLHEEVRVVSYEVSVNIGLLFVIANGIGREEHSGNEQDEDDDVFCGQKSFHKIIPCVVF